MIPHSELTFLESADAAFSAVDGRLIGVEVKKVNDAVNCMYTGRLADEQIPKMAAIYDVRYLVIEGTYRPEPGTGVLQTWREFDSSKPVKCGQWCDVTSGRKRLMYSAFESWVTTITTLGGISVRSTPSSQATASLITSLFSWYQRESHQSFDVMHMSEGNGAMLSRPTMLRRMLALLPHVGWERSAELQRRVSSVTFTAKATKRTMHGADWYIEGQIAEKSAKDIDKACDGNDD